MPNNFFTFTWSVPQDGYRWADAGTVGMGLSSMFVGGSVCMRQIPCPVLVPDGGVCWLGGVRAGGLL